MSMPTPPGDWIAAVESVAVNNHGVGSALDACHTLAVTVVDVGVVPLITSRARARRPAPP